MCSLHCGDLLIARARGGASSVPDWSMLSQASRPILESADRIVEGVVDSRVRVLEVAIVRRGVRGRQLAARDRHVDAHSILLSMPMVTVS
jgi:hypothetical protein